MATIDIFCIIKPCDKLREVKMSFLSFLIFHGSICPFAMRSSGFATLIRFRYTRRGEKMVPVTTEISRDPPGYPDRRLYRNYRHFMNQTHAYRRPRDYS